MTLPLPYKPPPLTEDKLLSHIYLHSSADEHCRSYSKLKWIKLRYGSRNYRTTEVPQTCIRFHQNLLTVKNRHFFRRSTASIQNTSPHHQELMQMVNTVRLCTQRRWSVLKATHSVKCNPSGHFYSNGFSFWWGRSVLYTVHSHQ